MSTVRVYFNVGHWGNRGLIIFAFLSPTELLFCLGVFMAAMYNVIALRDF